MDNLRSQDMQTDIFLNSWVSAIHNPPAKTNATKYDDIKS